MGSEIGRNKEKKSSVRQLNCQSEIFKVFVSIEYGYFTPLNGEALSNDLKILGKRNSSTVVIERGCSRVRNRKCGERARRVNSSTVVMHPKGDVMHHHLPIISWHGSLSSAALLTFISTTIVVPCIRQIRNLKASASGKSMV